MTAWKWLAVGVFSASTGLAQGPAPKPAPEPEPAPPRPVEDVPPPGPAPGRVSAVTVYQGNALVTREVAVPAGKGVVELVVTPLPPQTVDNSLYTEGAEGLRVLSTRYRTRAVREDTRKEVRAKLEQIKALQAVAQRARRELHVLGQNLEFLQKLEGFTAATMQGLAEKGLLDGKATIGLTGFVMESRAEKSAAMVGIEQQVQANAEATEFAERQLAELSAGSSRTEIDAVIVVDKADDPPASVRLNYLVGGATWRPQYRLRAGGEQDPVQLEQLAAIEQQSGEDWTAARLTLSTAQPSFNATIPDLKPLDISILPRDDEDGGTPGQAGQAPAEPDAAAFEEARTRAELFRGKARQELIGSNPKAGGALLNEAAALDQAAELLAKDEDGARDRAERPASEGPSVTFHLKGRLTVPSRKDPQLVEISRSRMAPEFFAKAVPVLSPRVYRLARLTNTGEAVLLPGEATVFVGTDFVGRMTLPQVAIGEQFTAGFGVDPQLQVGRRLVKKSRTIQGGNQVHGYEFRIVVRNFKATPATLQVWDRLPRAESEAVAVSLEQSKPAPSTDPLYVRGARPENLLRWDLVVPPGTIGEQAMVISYQFKLEYARSMAINYITAGGLKEAPIGGMGGMGGGMGGMGGFRSLPPEPSR